MYTIHRSTLVILAARSLYIKRLFIYVAAMNVQHIWWHTFSTLHSKLVRFAMLIAENVFEKIAITFDIVKAVQSKIEILKSPCGGGGVLLQQTSSRGSRWCGYSF